jgi:hypothetical protein
MNVVVNGDRLSERNLAAITDDPARKKADVR